VSCYSYISHLFFDYWALRRNVNHTRDGGPSADRVKSDCYSLRVATIYARSNDAKHFCQDATIINPLGNRQLSSASSADANLASRFPRAQFLPLNCAVAPLPPAASPSFTAPLLILHTYRASCRYCSSLHRVNGSDKLIKLHVHYLVAQTWVNLRTHSLVELCPLA